MSPVYASIDDYAVYTGEPIPAEFPPRIMAKASLEIDKALVGACYETDDDGMPTDSDVREAFRDATCAQARPHVMHYADPTAPTMTPPVPFAHLTCEAFDILRGIGLIPITLRMVG
jgi:hypothetical protein